MDAIVEGSVTLSGNQVRIGANLVRASPETHLWAEKATSVICVTFFHCKAIWPKQSRTKFRLS